MPEFSVLLLYLFTAYIFSYGKVNDVPPKLIKYWYKNIITYPLIVKINKFKFDYCLFIIINLKF